MATVWGLLLSLDGAIYDMVCYVYEIFYGLAGMNIFGMSDYQEIVSRIYIILGLLMLFVLTYVLLRAIVNPDEFSKGDKSFPKIIQNLIVSLVIIAVLPTVFTLIFNVQNAFLNQDTIPRLILGNPETGMEVSEGDVSDEYDTSNVSGGKVMAYYAFKAFFAPNIEGEACQDANTTDEDECRKDIGNNDGWFFGAGQSNAEEDSLAVTDQMILYKDGSFTYYNAFSEAVRDHNMKYYFPISTVAGVFILYVLLNFCFDMALRVIKLAFYQIIAPIPVICRVIPIGNLKDVFSKWVKQVTSLFVEVFIRIAALSLGVYLLQILISKWNSKQIDFSFFTRTGQKTIVLALLIMAIVMFIKKIPGIIGDMFGLDTSGLKLGLMDKLAMGGGLFAGAVAGGAITGFGRNLVNAGKNVKDAKGFGGKAKALIGGIGSTAAGGLSGGIHAGWAGRNAKNAKDMKGAVAKGASVAAANKAKRDRYKAMPGSVIGNRVLDKVDSVGDYFGFNSLEDLQKKQSVYQEAMGYKGKAYDIVADNERVLAYKGLKQAAQERELSEYMKNGLSESEAIQAKTAEIEKYDTAIKLASEAALRDKKVGGDERVAALEESYSTFAKQNANIDGIAGTSMHSVSDEQLAAIEAALGSNDAAQIQAAKKMLEGSEGSILFNDKFFKIKNGAVTRELAQKMQEKKSKEQ